MILLFTDFGLQGPYIGQMKAVLLQKAPTVPVVELISDVPAFNARAAAYLLAAYAREFPRNSVFLCVVDPGVGGDRRAALVKADQRWFVGPDNGLFSVLARRASDVRWWDIVWRPPRLSASFHGRDLFAPVAAGLALGELPPVEEQSVEPRVHADWPEDLAQVIYIDHFGNAMIGVRAQVLSSGSVIEVGGQALARARTFSDVAPGEAFWYENSIGLAEIAVNKGRADQHLHLSCGAPIKIRY